jgi:hypothetical protein
VLVTLVRPECTAEHAAELIAATPGLLDAAQRHAMVALIFDRWAAELEAGLAAAEFDRWRQAFLWLVSLCHSRRHEVAGLLGALGEAGVPVVVMRGQWLAEAIYADPVLRPHGDVDIIVPPAAAPLVAPVLESRGFALREESSLMAAREQGRDLPSGHYDTWGGWTRHLAGMLPIRVDVHVGLQLAAAYWWPFRPSPDEVMEHSQPWEFVGVSTRCLGLHYALLAQCENIARHSVGRAQADDRLIRYHDLRLLIPRLSATDWDEFLADVRALRLGVPVWLVLQRAAELWDLQLPADLRTRLGVTAAALAMARTALRQPRWLGHWGHKALFQVATAGSLPVAAAYLCRNLLLALRSATARPSSRQATETS